MIGLPRSGKSTICQEWLDGNIEIVDCLPRLAQASFTRPFRAKLPPRIVVNDDSIRMAITGDRFNFAAESQVYALKYGMIRTLLSQGYEVMVDDTHTTTPSIQRLLEIDTSADFCFVDTDVDTCIKRAIESKQGDLVGVIHRMGKNLQNLVEDNECEFIHPYCPTKLSLISSAVQSIREDVIERNEHTKRV